MPDIIAAAEASRKANPADDKGKTTSVYVNQKGEVISRYSYDGGDGKVHYYNAYKGMKSGHITINGEGEISEKEALERINSYNANQGGSASYRPGDLLSSSILTYTPPPSSLPGFPGSERVKPKGGRPRWRLPDGKIGEWDGQHGEVEVYNPRGKHVGVWNPDGEQIKPPVPGRTIDPFSGFSLPSFSINPTVLKVGAIIGIGALIIVTDGAAAPLLAL